MFLQRYLLGIGLIVGLFATGCACHRNRTDPCARPSIVGSVPIAATPSAPCPNCNTAVPNAPLPGAVPAPPTDMPPPPTVNPTGKNGGQSGVIVPQY